MRAGPVLLALAFVWPASAVAQGLGDAAAREKTRRAKTPSAAAPVFTDADLEERARERSGEGDAVEEEGNAAGDPSAASGAPSSELARPVDPVREELDREREERALLEREWRARFAEARTRLREAEARCWQEVVRTDYFKGIPVQMKVQEFVETEEFRRARADLAALEEEFRRSGLPAGWARE